MPGVSAPNNTEPKGPKHLNMIEMAAPSNYYNTALEKVAPPGRSFDGVGSEGTLQEGHVALLFSVNQIRDSKWKVNYRS